MFLVRTTMETNVRAVREKNSINKLICGLKSIKPSTMEINNDKSCARREIYGDRDDVC